MNKGIGTIILGIIIVLIGVIFLGNNINLWDINIFSIFFDGWWTLFIIVPSLIGLFKEKALFASGLGLIIGILLLLAAQDVILWSMVGKIFIPIVIIMVGLLIIFKSNVRFSKKKAKNVGNYIGVFSGTSEKISGKFSGCNCVSVFGGVDLDIRDADIDKDIVIDCVSIFGGIDIITDKNVRVKTNGVPIFGGVENKNDSDKGPIININYVCIFGGIEIK